MELTKAIPPAAAVPARSAVGMLQKIDKQAMIPTMPTVAAATEIHVLAPYAALNPRPKPATIAADQSVPTALKGPVGTAACQ